MSAAPGVLLAVLCAAAAAACGEGEGGGSAAAEQRIEAAVRKTRSAGTVGFRMEIRSSGGPDVRFDAEGRADFDTDRERYRLEVLALPGLPAGSKIEAFSDSGDEYLKLPGAERFMRLSEQSPVPNGVTDSLGALATDLSDVTRAGSGSVAGVPCTRYRASLDAEKVAERADLGRSVEAERQAAAIDDAPVSLCVDRRELLREFIVEFAVPDGDGYTLRAVAELRDFGTAEPLPPFEEIE